MDLNKTMGVNFAIGSLTFGGVDLHLVLKKYENKECEREKEKNICILSWKEGIKVSQQI